jgi:hypothetical protein
MRSEPSRRAQRRRDRLVGVRITSSELQRWHRSAAAADLTLAELVREAVRIYARQLAVEIPPDRGAEAQP